VTAVNARQPALRCREGQAIKYCPVGTVVIGKPVGADGDVVFIDGARGRHIEVYLEDLEAVIGGPDLTVGLIMDAVDHGDQVRIGVEKDRITYSNPAQLARFLDLASDLARR
jgi:hypothetical protein